MTPSVNPDIGQDTHTLYGNQLYLMALVLAHNLTKEIQMLAASPSQGTAEKRSPLWGFTELSWIRHHLLQRAGCLTEPQGKLTLTLCGNDAVKRDLLHFLDALKEAA